MVEGEEEGGDEAEVCVQRDGAEVYGRNYRGVFAGNAGEGTWVLVGEPVGEDGWVRETGFEVDELLGFSAAGGRSWRGLKREESEGEKEEREVGV